MKQKVEEQIETICTRTVEVLPEDDLRAKFKQSLENNQPLVIKFGVDPTAPDLHLGHTIALNKLRTFQDLGHQVILLIGDYTAKIGDPSERIATRPQLKEEEIKENAKTYTDQAFKILDKEKITIKYNSNWFSKMIFEDVLKLAAKFTVARLIERDDFSERFKKNIPISLHEFIYPVMQAYDSVILKSDVEIGGTDQKFNMLAGRDLQEKFDQKPQVVITLPILEGIDGVKKMSKSLGNQIGLTEPPGEMFGKIMSIPDELMVKYFQLVTKVDKKEVKEIEKGLKADKLHPAEVKRRLGREIVSQYYDEEAAKNAEKAFDAKHKPEVRDRLSDEQKVEIFHVEEVLVDEKEITDGKVWIIKLLRWASVADSNNKARRLIEQRAVRLRGKLIDNPELEVDIIGEPILKVGKKFYGRVYIGPPPA